MPPRPDITSEQLDALTFAQWPVDPITGKAIIYFSFELPQGSLTKL